jgi:hypothetical protein
MTDAHAHDSTRQDLCGCARCDAMRTVSLAASRATTAAQAAVWRPRSRKLAAAAQAARKERREAMDAAAALGCRDAPWRLAEPY